MMLHSYILLTTTIIIKLTTKTTTSIRTKSWQTYLSAKAFHFNASLRAQHGNTQQIYIAFRNKIRGTGYVLPVVVQVTAAAESTILRFTRSYTKPKGLSKVEFFPVTGTSCAGSAIPKLQFMNCRLIRHVTTTKHLAFWCAHTRRRDFLQSSPKIPFNYQSHYRNKINQIIDNKVYMSSTMDKNNNSNDTMTTIEPTNINTKKPIVQYIFVRTDLKTTKPGNTVDDNETILWSNGAIAAQVAHASVAAIANGLQYNDVYTKQYIDIPTNQLQNMTKLVYAVSNEEELRQIQKVWFEQQQYTIANDSKSTADSNGSVGKGYLWQEQPENTPTAFATWPVERTNAISKLIKKLKVSFY
jgi:peptidyl-tRNA hydrolase